jgi:hypothetical protein
MKRQGVSFPGLPFSPRSRVAPRLLPGSISTIFLLFAGSLLNALFSRFQANQAANRFSGWSKRFFMLAVEPAPSGWIPGIRPGGPSRLHGEEMK